MTTNYSAVDSDEPLPAAMLSAVSMPELMEHARREEERNVDEIVRRRDEAATWEVLSHLTGSSPGRIHTPRPLRLIYTRGWFNTRPSELPVALYQAWSGSEFPLSSMRRSVWRPMFTTAGFVVNGEAREQERPADPLRLYRGARPRFRRRWSWTDDLETAVTFTKGTRDGGVVWTSTVEPRRLLARFHEPGVGRGEHEWVVDTEGLEIRRHEQ